MNTMMSSLKLSDLGTLMVLAMMRCKNSVEDLILILSRLYLNTSMCVANVVMDRECLPMTIW